MLSDREKQCMLAWVNTQEEFDVMAFSTIASYSGLDIGVIRRTVRSLARKGYTIFVRGCMTEEGIACGSGYGLTEQGRIYINGTA